MALAWCEHDDLAVGIDARAGMSKITGPWPHLVREVIGNPFRPPPGVAPGLLAWRDGLVVKLAQAAYDERSLPDGLLDNSRLAVLADALEEAGCQNEEILRHLREQNGHWRGCWALDILLGKA
jgi:hypothetical protein